jgi:hypothetical protein
LPMRQHQSAVMVEHDWHVIPQGQTLSNSNRESEETGVIER